MSDHHSNVISLAERRYRDFVWRPDPSPREGVELSDFSQRCGLNAIESLARALAGYKLHPRFVTDGRGNFFWRAQ